MRQETYFSETHFHFVFENSKTKPAGTPWCISALMIPSCVSVQKITSYVTLTIKTHMVGQIDISRQQHPKYMAMIHLLASHAKVVAKGPTKRSANLLGRPNLARLRPDAHWREASHRLLEVGVRVFPCIS